MDILEKALKNGREIQNIDISFTEIRRLDFIYRKHVIM